MIRIRDYGLQRAFCIGLLHNSFEKCLDGFLIND